MEGSILHLKKKKLSWNLKHFSISAFISRVYLKSIRMHLSLSQTKIAKKKSLFIFSSIVCWQLLMTPRHFLVYRVSWPLHSFCSHKKLSLRGSERDLRDERSSYRCLRSLLRYMAPLNPTLMAATASQRDLSQKIASRIGFSSSSLFKNAKQSQIWDQNTCFYHKFDFWKDCYLKIQS